MATNQYVIQYINSVLSKASENILEHFVIDMEPEELYAMICGGDNDMLATFSRAAGYLPKDNFFGQVKVPVLMHGRYQSIQLKFNVSMESCAKYRSYFIPESVAAITPESNLYEKILPAITLAQDWQISMNLFEQFSPVLSTDQIAFVLPWLRELGRDAWEETKDLPDHFSFASQHGMGYASAKRFETIRVALRRLGNPGRSTTPALTKRVNEATRIGDRLFSQWRMLKKEKARRQRGSFVSVALDNVLLPEWYRTDMQDILHTWEQHRLGLGHDDSGE
jgi:hypothetical protein